MMEVIGIVGIIAILIGLEYTTAKVYQKMLVDEIKRIEKEKNK